MGVAAMRTDTIIETRRARLRERLETIRGRSEKSGSWRESTRHLARLVNGAGYVPVTTRLSRGDLAFIAGARDEVIAFADLCLRLLDLHRAQEAGGITSDPGHPLLRCRSCMGRWPCPTVRAVEECLAEIPGG
jgi:hypothetical protein